MDPSILNILMLTKQQMHNADGLLSQVIGYCNQKDWKNAKRALMTIPMDWSAKIDPIRTYLDQVIEEKEKKHGAH